MQEHAVDVSENTLYSMGTATETQIIYIELRLPAFSAVSRETHVHLKTIGLMCLLSP